MSRQYLLTESVVCSETYLKRLVSPGLPLICCQIHTKRGTKHKNKGTYNQDCIAFTVSLARFCRLLPRRIWSSRAARRWRTRRRRWFDYHSFTSVLLNCNFVQDCPESVAMMASREIQDMNQSTATGRVLLGHQGNNLCLLPKNASLSNCSFSCHFWMRLVGSNCAIKLVGNNCTIKPLIVPVRNPTCSMNKKWHENEHKYCFRTIVSSCFCCVEMFWALSFIPSSGRDTCLAIYAEQTNKRTNKKVTHLTFD
jgi:hypothetical protein